MKDESLICPVCRKFYFDEPNCFDFCPVCGWFDDLIQRENPDYEGGCNHRSQNQHREQWKNGTLPDYIYDLIEQNRNRLPPE